MIANHGFKLSTSKRQACMATFRAQATNDKLRRTGTKAASSMPPLCIKIDVINPCSRRKNVSNAPSIGYVVVLRSKLETSAGSVFPRH